MKTTLQLPFDQYQRYRLVSDIINKFRINEKKFKILEIGAGTEENLKKFLPLDDIFSLDKRGPDTNSPEERFIVADVLKTELNQKFDFVIALDVFEHVLPAERNQFLDILIESSKIASILAGPFDMENVKYCEFFANEFYKIRHHANHIWLQEHLDHGLPSLSSTIDIINKRDLETIIIPNGYLPHWFEMMSIYLITIDQPEISQMIMGLNEFYNQYYYHIDNREPAYRHVLIIPKITNIPVFSDLSCKQIDFKVAQLKEILLKSFIEKISQSALIAKKSEKEQQLLEYQQIISGKEQEIARITTEYDSLNNEIIHLRTAVNYLMSENDALKNSIVFCIVNKFHRHMIEPCFPQNTKRREIYDLGLKGGRIAIKKGFKQAFSEYKEYRRHKKLASKNLEVCIFGPTSPSESLVHVKPITSKRRPTQTPKIQKNEQDPFKFIFSTTNLKSPDYIPLADNAVQLKRDDIKYIAFYLPQFHPIPENDLWWGKGFTEWTNVARALPQFIGHYQPHIPDELGYYDLRLPEIQKRQVELARHYGVYGFCFYYYWFNGKRLLEKPLNQYLEHSEFDLPFCICWANENWTRCWDGMDNDVLISQDHNAENDLMFIHDVEHILKDPRYICIDGKPLLIIYRAMLLPEPEETLKRWRGYCRKCGIGEIYLIAAICFGCEDPTKYGFDAGIEFPPHTMYNRSVITNTKKIINPEFSGNIFDYEDFVYSKRYLYPTNFKLFKTVSPGWDNTARRPNNATIFAGATPQLYKKWLYDVSRLTQKRHPQEEHIVFINAWNEWAEGAHLEPDKKYGYGYLQATSEVVTKLRNIAKTPHEKKKIIVVSHDAHLHGAQMLALHIVKTLSKQLHYEVHVLLKSGGMLEEDFRRYATVYNLEEICYEEESVDKLIKTLYRNNIRLAICNTVVSGDIAEILSRNGIKTISLIHELPGVIRQFRQEENAKKISEFADSVVFPSEHVKKHFLEIQPVAEDKCKIAPQGLFLKNKYRDNKDEAGKLLREQFSLPEDSKIVLNIGYADYRKAPDIFVEVAKKIIEEQKDVYFIWLGLMDENFMIPVYNEIEKAGIKDKIIFPGICRENIDIYYSGADVFLLTSREDPFPSVVLDAMNTGIPVVGFDDVGGFKDVVTEDTGILVPYPSIERMTAELLGLLEDSNRRAQLGSNAAKLIDTKYNFTDYVYKLLEFLGEDYKKVSVIIPNYNYEQYLPERLDSVLSQTYPVYEIIVLDDCSTDNSTGIINNFAQISAINIKISINKTNSGSAFRQWARGINMATGDYIWIAEADDLSDPLFLETAMKGFIDDTVVLSYTQSYKMDETGSIIVDNYLEYAKDIDENRWKECYTRDGRDEIRDALVIKNTIPNVSAVVFKKIDISGSLEPLFNLKNAGDWFFYTCLLEQGRISYNPSVLNYHRRHGKSVTRQEKAEEHFNEIVFMQEYIINRYEIDDAVLLKVKKYREFVKNYLLGS